MQIKLIFTRKFVHLASFWKWEFLELGSGLFDSHETIRGMGTSFRRSDFWDRFGVQAYLVYIFKIFTQLNRDSHWLILGHVALTKIKSVYPDRHVIKHGGKVAKAGKTCASRFIIVMSKHKPGASSRKVMIFEVIQGKWRKEMRIIRGKYFKSFIQRFWESSKYPLMSSGIVLIHSLFFVAVEVKV